MHTIELFFDEVTDNYIKALWDDIENNDLQGISVRDIENMSPHITLGVFYNIEEEEHLIEKFNEYFTYINHDPLILDVPSIGMFPTTGTLFVKPTVTTKLLTYHKEFHKNFSYYKDNANEYYLPEKWEPHVTLGLNMSNQNILKAIELIMEDFVPIASEVVKVALVHVDFDGERYLGRRVIQEILLK